MILKPRSEPKELKLFRSLYLRTSLSEKEMNHYFNLEKGFMGEQMLDEKLLSLSKDYLTINDLLLENNRTIFQIDKLIISSKKVHLFEIKNYEGDYYIEGDRWYTKSNIEIKNPLLQLKRNETLLRRTLQDFGFNSPIESHLIFVNPDFYLYQAPLNLPIIFPSQMNRFIKSLNSNSSKLTNNHVKLAKQLVARHLKESPFTRLPNYNYEELKKE